MNTENKRKKGLAGFLVAHPLLSGILVLVGYIFILYWLTYLLFVTGLPLELGEWIGSILAVVTLVTLGLVYANYTVENQRDLEKASKELFRMWFKAKTLPTHIKLTRILDTHFRISQKKKVRRQNWNGSMKELLDWRIWEDKSAHVNTNSNSKQ